VAHPGDTRVTMGDARVTWVSCQLALVCCTQGEVCVCVCVHMWHTEVDRCMQPPLLLLPCGTREWTGATTKACSLHCCCCGQYQAGGVLIQWR
jgi:hypothetical protein